MHTKIWWSYVHIRYLVHVQNWTYLALGWPYGWVLNFNFFLINLFAKRGGGSTATRPYVRAPYVFLTYETTTKLSKFPRVRVGCRVSVRRVRWTWTSCRASSTRPTTRCRSSRCTTACSHRPCAIPRCSASRTRTTAPSTASGARRTAADRSSSQNFPGICVPSYRLVTGFSILYLRRSLRVYLGRFGDQWPGS